MHRLNIEALTAVGTWAIATTGLIHPVPCDQTAYNLTGLAARLSSNASMYYPGSDGFDEASIRWSNLDAPQVNTVVVPATENDVIETVAIPFQSLSPPT
jgi:hypothetical protein